MMQGSVRIPTHLLGVLCEYFEVTERTVRRWQKEGAPAYVLRFIELHEGLRESWNGVCVRDGLSSGDDVLLLASSSPGRNETL